jgi:hypothetical protein
MSRGKPASISPNTELIDAVLEGYVTWREQSAAVEHAYQSWGRASGSDRGDAFAGYLDALDREERAADRYRRLIEQVDPGPQLDFEAGAR